MGKTRHTMARAATLAFAGIKRAKGRRPEAPALSPRTTSVERDATFLKRAPTLVVILGAIAACSVSESTFVDLDATVVDAPAADAGTDGALTDAMIDAVDAMPIDAPPPPPPTSIPSLQSPWNGYATGSIHDTTGPTLPRQPTFRWQAAAGATHYRVQYKTGCINGAISSCDFDTGVTTAFVSTITFAPGADLTTNTVAPVGARIFWRVSACSAPVDASCNATASPIRYVDVGRRNDDLNGDGYSDLVVGAVYAGPGTSGRVFVWYGGAAGLPAGNSAQDFVHADADMDDELGTGVAYGDLNGDGYADVVVGAPLHGSDDSGRACVYMGGPAQLTSVGCTWGSGVANGSFGYNVAIGDLNADGFADFAASATTEGKIWTYLGTSTTPMASGTSITTPGPGNFAFGLDATGDVNGDGYVDLVAGAANTPGTAYVFRGTAGGPTAASPYVLVGPASCTQFGYSIDTGDVDRDGYADIAIGCGPGAALGGVYLYRSSAAGPPATASQELVNPQGGGQAFCRVSIGDIDGDGYDDLIAGAYNNEVTANLNEGVSYLYRSNMGPLTAPTTLESPTHEAGGQFGSSVDFNHDFNGDGRADLAISASSHDGTGGAANEGRVFVFTTTPGGAIGSGVTYENRYHEPNGAFGVNLRH